MELEKESVMLRKGIKDAALQLQEIIKANTGKSLLLLENGEISPDHLVNGLQELQRHLTNLDEEENKRTWVSQGLASFVDILKYSGEVETFYENIISSLIKYLNANQGGLFIVTEEGEETRLELASCYAYDRKKYLEKIILPGEGLIGQCYLEKEYILLTDLPDGYTYITSGLGEATPACLLMLPLIANDRIVGVMEIASFFVMEKYHLEFLLKLAENIASVILNIQTNENTKRLLKTSQEQTEQLKQQEEELRQNMDDLSDMQERILEQLADTKNLKKELEIREDVFGHTTILSESDIHGTITYVNDKLCSVSQYSRNELIGKAHNIFRHPDTPPMLFKLMWQTIRQGKIFQGIIKNKAKDGTYYWVDATIVPVKNENGAIIKYIGARYHIQDDLLAETLYEKQIRKLLHHTGLTLVEEGQPV